jgi:hypothetical protein
MCVLPSLIRVSCTQWANIESLFFGGSDAVYLRGGGAHVKAVSGRCLTGNIWAQQLTVAIPNDLALCIPGAGEEDLEPPLAQYVATERVPSPGGRENTCECRD